MEKEYSNGELTIVWQPDKCTHSGVCVKSLPEVYNPKEKPWIKQHNAKTEQLVRQIDACPSRALSYYFNKDEKSGVFSENEEKKRYELQLEGKTAFIEYIKAKGTIYLTHTEVPAELEGKGVGSRMLLQALVDIKQKDLTLVPLCPFVAGYLKKHPAWKELVLKGINIA
ncbi:N-acetyltransferase [Carboxylicivirga sp. RSCT41]|uniref:N-acetyltransferase n=1 Tax=Carboxylicivirga agarovorans TaxID=3417570 RepID=UPI003D34E480